MHEEKARLELIERYLDGQLEEGELSDFEKMLKEDEKLFEEVQFEKNFRELEETDDILLFRENVAGIFHSL
jgi:hypothetical protein